MDLMWDFSDRLLAPTFSREKHQYFINAPSAGEGAYRGGVKNQCSIQNYMLFKQNSCKSYFNQVLKISTIFWA